MAEDLSPETIASLDAALGVFASDGEPPAPQESSDVESEPPAAAQPVEPAEPEAEPAEAQPEAEPEASKSEPDLLSDLPGILRTKKRAEARAREAEEKAAREVAEAKEELEKLRAQVQASIDNPVEYFRERGFNVLEVARTLAAAELPADKADPQARLRYEQARQRREAQSEIQKLRADLEGFKQQQEQAAQAKQAEQILAEVRREDQALLSTDIPSDSLLSGLYRVNPDYALDQLLEFRRAHATKYPDERIPTGREAAEYLEKQLEAIGYQAPPPAAQESAQPTAKTPPAEPEPTISSNELAGRTAKDEPPEDEEELIKYLAGHLKAGTYLE